MRTIAIILMLALSACVSYPEEAVELRQDDALTSETYVLPLTLNAVQSRLLQHEKFCGPFQTIEFKSPTQGVWRKYTATLSGETQEVLVIRLVETEAGATGITGYAAGEQWLPYTESFVRLIMNPRNCSANL